MVFHADPASRSHARGSPKYRPPSNSRTKRMSAPSTTSARSGEFDESEGHAKEGRRFAKPPRACRNCNRPASGRRSGGSALNSLPPTAPSSTASLSSAASRVDSGRGDPCCLIATPPMRASLNSKSYPPSSATERRMRTASAVTSGPIPSPATTSTLSFIVVSLRVWRRARRKSSVRFRDGFVVDQVFVSLVVRHQVDQVLVIDGLLAVGQLGEGAISNVEILRREVITQCDQ